MSADGVVGDPQLWAMDYRDKEVETDALERLAGSDAMLMGRGTYELFAATWPGQAGAFADRMNSIRKYVFSSTLEKAEWNNSAVIRGDAVAEAARIKQQDGQHITSAWNSTASQSGENVTITNASYNGAIPPGGNTSLGFQGTWPSSDAAPTSFTLNDTTCTS